MSLPPNPLPCGCRVEMEIVDTGKQSRGVGTRAGQPVHEVRRYVVHCPLHAQADALAASHARLLAACRKMIANRSAIMVTLPPPGEIDGFAEGYDEMEAIVAQAPKEPT